MASNKKIIVGNWKLHPTQLSEAKKIFSGVKRTAKSQRKTLAVICPPCIFISELAKLSVKRAIELGAQDVFYEESGAFTGEVSAKMIRAAGGSYSIVGHSERRRLGDTNTIIAKKLFAGVKAGLNMILCVGEHARDEHGIYLAYVHDQLLSALEKINSKLLRSVIIAYEPVWAIGQSEKEAITPRHLHEMVIYVKKLLSDKYGEASAASVLILYGGSVFAHNAREFLTDGQSDGLLIGRESLDYKDFDRILKIANGI